MSDETGQSHRSETDVIVVRYWAGAKAAAGVDHDDIPVNGPVTLTDLMARAVKLHPNTRLGDVVQICSVLIGERPAGAEDPNDVLVHPGATVEFLPPFAGG
ncbi:MoaD/ThiS family protein [Nocardioides pacificus]